MPIKGNEIALMRCALAAEGVSGHEVEYVLALAVKVDGLPPIETTEQYIQMKSALRRALSTMGVSELHLIEGSTKPRPLYCHALMTRLHEWLELSGRTDAREPKRVYDVCFRMF